jgi:O-antigen ligase
LTNNYYQWGLRLFILWNEQVQMLHLMGMFALLAGLEKKLRFPLFAGIVIYLLCVFQVFLSTSRAVLVGTGATFLFTMLLRFWHRKIAWLGIPLFAIIVVFLLVYLKALMNEMAVKATSITLERLQTMSLQNADLSVLFRLFSYQSALQTALQHPFLGICLNSGYYLEIFGVKYFTTILDNTFLKLALSAGFPSLLFYLVCLFVIYKYSFKTLKKVDSGMDRAVLLSLISVVCMANVVEFFHSNIFFLRVMPMVTFAWAGLMRLKQAYDVK